MPNQSHPDTYPEKIPHRAAALMRERAEGASPSPWRGEKGFCSGPVVRDAWDREVVEEWHASEEDAHYIASWHPAVALAVAELVACPCEGHAQSAARAYLGRPDA